MAKPIIAIDIDDVLADERDSIMHFVNELYGLNLTVEDYNIEAQYWGYWEAVWQLNKEEGAKRFDSYIASGVKAEQRIMEGALETITELKRDYRLVIITARDDKQVALTHEWLDRHFPGVFEEIAFVHLWSGDKKGSKAQIATKLGAAYLIDDNVGHCELAAEAGMQALLFGDYGWNRSAVIGDKITRVKDWREVRDYFYGR